MGNTHLHRAPGLLCSHTLEKVVSPPVETSKAKNGVDVLAQKSAKQACRLALVLGYF